MDIRLRSRKILDGSFTGLGMTSIILMALALLILMVPIFSGGIGAFIFKGTVSFRQFQLDQYGRGDSMEVAREMRESDEYLKPVYEMMESFRKNELENWETRAEEIQETFEEIQEDPFAYTPDEKIETQIDLLRELYSLEADIPGETGENVPDIDYLMNRATLLEDLLPAVKADEGTRKQLARIRREILSLDENPDRSTKGDFIDRLDAIAEKAGLPASDLSAWTATRQHLLNLVNTRIWQLTERMDTVRLETRISQTMNELEAMRSYQGETGQRLAVYRNLMELSQIIDPGISVIDQDALESRLDFIIRDRIGQYEDWLDAIKDEMYSMFGPRLGEQPASALLRSNYGRTRWDEKSREHFRFIMKRSEWEQSEGDGFATIDYTDRRSDFAGTSLVQMFDYLEENIENIVMPETTFYWQFLTDEPLDAHFFGGIWPELLGTFYLTIGAMIFAVPLGVIAAIYLTEFAKEGKLISLLRTFISTLAGVPSIVFGLFGLAFFINTIGVSGAGGKSVIAGSMTLAILILPTIIKASEEAIRSVPQTYKEAALSLGATRWRTVVTIILPAAMPGILTGIVISMGRAAGETAPIIFTAAVSVGKALRFDEIFSNATPALSWNIYNVSTEHEAVDEIRHVQYGMVLVLVLLVLVMNLAAIFMRARISKKLRG